MTVNNSPYIDDDGLPIFDSSTGLFDGVELTTKGDVLTRTTSNYVRKAVGTDADTLTSDSTQSDGLNYATKSAGSSVILLGTGTASASTEITFTSEFDDSTYAYYIFTFTNVRPTTDGVELRVRFSVNGGSSYLSSDYRWCRLRLNASSGSTGIGENDSDSKIKMVVDLGNAAGEGLSGKALYIPSPSPGSENAGKYIHDNCYVRDSGTFFRNFGAGMNETSSVVNGIRWYMSSGTIATGTWKMYGVENS